MKRWLNILIFVCVLITASSIKAEDRPSLESRVFSLKEDLKKFFFQDFLEIKIFHKSATQVYILGDNAEKLGLDKKELDDYLSINVRNYFPDIKLEIPDYAEYTEEQIGYINFRIWTVGDDYPVLYHLKCTCSPFSYEQLWEEEIMGCVSKDKVFDTIKKKLIY